MENFFAGRMLLRSAKEQFGIYPGEEEIDSFIRKLRAFTGRTASFPKKHTGILSKRASDASVLWKATSVRSPPM